MGSIGVVVGCSVVGIAGRKVAVVALKPAVGIVSTVGAGSIPLDTNDAQPVTVSSIIVRLTLR
jgi:hypothetical protein